MLGAVHRLLRDGHELAGVFTFACDNVFNFNRETLALAKQLGVPAVLSPPQDLHIDGFLDKGARCFLAAGYPFKMPPIDETRAYGINMHPSLLPQGRGLMPTPHIIMNAPQAAGLTIHKLTAEFDAGDILAQQAFKIGECETVETYSARCALLGPNMLSNVMADLPGHWLKAKPQSEKKATHFPPPGDDMRLLDWADGIEKIDRTARAFGRFGSLARFDDALWVVYHLDCWADRHNHTPGTVVLRASREIVVAARDGFVCLKDFQPAKI